LPVISAVGHETDFTICDFVSDLRAPTPSAAAELAVPETDVLMRRFHNVVDRMALLCERGIKRGKERLHGLSSRRVFTDPDVLYRAERQRLDACFTALSHAADKLLYTKKGSLEETAARLNAMSPLSILSRGYAVPIKEGKTVKSVEELSLDTAFSLQMADGTLQARVTGREKQGDCYEKDGKL
jgi:exodeoxyribonuclease VII large subunit